MEVKLFPLQELHDLYPGASYKVGFRQQNVSLSEEIRPKDAHTNQNTVNLDSQKGVQHGGFSDIQELVPIEKKSHH